MAKITIAGTECTFVAIPISTLQAYGPIQRTHLALWKTDNTQHTLYLQMHLHMLESIDAIDRLFLFQIEGGTTGALFDYEAGATRLLQDFENYMRILCHTSHHLECPWRTARHEVFKQEVDRLYQMDERLIDIYREKATTKAPIPKEAILTSLMLTPDTQMYYENMLAATAGRHPADTQAIEGRERLLLNYERYGKKGTDAA